MEVTPAAFTIACKLGIHNQSYHCHDFHPNLDDDNHHDPPNCHDDNHDDNNRPNHDHDDDKSS